MRTAMRPRYYCDHCNKGNGSASAMKRHEKGCTANPNRVCGMCKIGGDEPAPSRDVLIKELDTKGFAAMCALANDCPACILSALHTKNGIGEFGQPIVMGPEDGRQTWSYRKAKDEWWAIVNDAKYQEDQERMHYYC